MQDEYAGRGSLGKIFCLFCPVTTENVDEGIIDMIHHVSPAHILLWLRDSQHINKKLISKGEEDPVTRCLSEAHAAEL